MRQKLQAAGARFWLLIGTACLIAGALTLHPPHIASAAGQGRESRDQNDNSDRRTPGKTQRRESSRASNEKSGSRRRGDGDRNRKQPERDRARREDVGPDLKTLQERKEVLRAELAEVQEAIEEQVAELAELRERVGMEREALQELRELRARERAERQQRQVHDHEHREHHNRPDHRDAPRGPIRDGFLPSPPVQPDVPREREAERDGDRERRHPEREQVDSPSTERELFLRAIEQGIAAEREVEIEMALERELDREAARWKEICEREAIKNRLRQRMEDQPLRWPPADAERLQREARERNVPLRDVMQDGFRPAPPVTRPNERRDSDLLPLIISLQQQLIELRGEVEELRVEQAKDLGRREAQQTLQAEVAEQQRQQRIEAERRELELERAEFEQTRVKLELTLEDERNDLERTHEELEQVREELEAEQAELEQARAEFEWPRVRASLTSPADH